MKFIVKQDRDIAKAHFEFRKFTAEEKERALEQTRFKEVTDRANEIKRAEKRGLEKGIQKGIETGKEEGLKKGKLETARKMLLENLDIVMICKITGLSEEEINMIRSDLQE